MHINHCYIHDELQERINNTPEIANIKARNYVFYEFFDSSGYAGFVGYWNPDLTNYAFVVARSYTKGMGFLMMQHLVGDLRGSEVKWLIAVIDPNNTRSQRMAARLGFSSKAYIAAKQTINNPNIREDLLVWALKIN